MIFTAPMKLLAAVVLEHDSDAVTRELLRQGTLDFVSVKELSGQLESRVDSVTPKVSLARTGELRKRVEGLINLADPPVRVPELSIDSMGPVDLDAMDKALDAIGLEINGIRERQKGYQEEILKLEEIRRQVEVFDSLKAGPSLASSYSFLSMQTGMVLSARLPELEKALESLPCVVLPSEREDELHTGVLLITMKRDDARVNQILAQHGWEDVALPAEMTGGKAEAVRDLDGKIETLRAKQRECASLINGCLSDKAEKLGRMWTELRVNELFARIQSCFSRTSRTLLFSGWIPKEKQREIEAGIRGAAGGRCYLEWISPEAGEAKEIPVPVEMRNPEILRPFQNLVTNYAIPEYGTIDPTPFVAVAYLAMFGLMFGDAGHGLVIFVIGIIGTLLARKKGKKDNLYRLITYCGAAAMVTGVLFGSYFGTPLFPPLWFDYHGIISGHSEHAGGIITDIYDILGITIRFGIVVIGLGLLLNWVNLVRKKRWLTLLLDKGGLIGGWIYGAGTWAAFYFVGHNYKQLPPGGLLLWLLGIPTLILAVKGPLEFFLHGVHEGKKFNGFTIIDFLMEWIVEVLEIYSGYLANTLSFMRVAGLGIAHVSLMIAFAQIARMITPEGPYSIGSWAIILLGNVLVIALEGLSAGIQSLRLNYYEFFSKYFNGTGKAYRPISLRSRD